MLPLSHCSRLGAVGWALEGVAAGRGRVGLGRTESRGPFSCHQLPSLPGLYLARGCQMSEALEICQSDFLCPEPEGQRGERTESRRGARGRESWERDARQRGGAYRVCVGGGNPDPVPPQHLCWVGPLLSSWCPALSHFPPRTYQEHEDDGALVDVVHQIAGLLAKPAPAKMEWL